MAKIDHIAKVINMLDTLSIKNVYYIDDEIVELGVPQESAVVTALLRALDGAQRASIEHLLTDPILTAPKSQRRSVLLDYFEKFDSPSKPQHLKEIGTALSVPSDVQGNKQSIFLANTIGRKVKFQAVNPATWVTMQDSVITNSSNESRVLCFFDQRLNDQKGEIANSPLSGTKLIKDLIAEGEVHHKSENIFCILFTSETTVEGEFNYWRQKVADSGMESSKFFPLSKERVDDDRLFAEGIKLSSLNSLYDVIRVQTQQLIDAADKAAVSELNGIHLYDLNFMVDLTSKDEGVWEASTLLRIHEILREEHLRKQMISTKYAAQFNQNMDKVSKITHIYPYLPQSDHASKHRLRHRELYEEATTLNGLYTELRTGDIFKDLSNGHEFIVVAQPCDMVVRTNGERKSTAATLVPIKIVTKAEFDAKVKDSPNYSKGIFQLEYYNSGANEIGCVEFNSYYSIEVNILDLAVLNKEGLCRIDIAQDPPVPPHDLPSAWKKRFVALNLIFSEIHSNLIKLETGLDQTPDIKELVTSLLPASYRAMTNNKEKNIQSSKPKFDSNELNYNLSRVKSLRAPLSAYLLEAYSRYLSRVAYEHDFSVVKADTAAKFTEPV